MKHLLQIAALFALLAPAPAQELEKLREETAALEAQITKVRELAAAKAKLELLRHDLAEAKKGKPPSVGASARARLKAKPAPTWPPALEVGQVVVAKTAAGVWWFVERRRVTGLLSLHEYGKGESARRAARKFAAAVRKDANHAKL